MCLADYITGDEIRILAGCKHKFHKDCVDRWLATGSSFCPICRERAIIRPEGLEPGGDGGTSPDEHWEYLRRFQVRLEISVVPPPLMNGSGFIV